MSDLSHFPQTTTVRDVLVQPATAEIDGAEAHGEPRTVPLDASYDRVIRSLSSALEAAEQGQDRYSIEALRLAIAVRLGVLQAQLRTTDVPGDALSRGRPIQALQKWRLKRVEEYVESNLSEKISLSDLAAVAGLSRMHFASQFRMATGFRPHEFLLRRRVQRAEGLLRESAMTIVEIALTLGFQTQAHFTTVFKRFVGRTPHQWRCASGLQRATRPHAIARPDVATGV